RAAAPPPRRGGAGALGGRLLGAGVEPPRAAVDRPLAPRALVGPRLRGRRVARRGHDAVALGRRRAGRRVHLRASARPLVVGRLPLLPLALERGGERSLRVCRLAPDPARPSARLASLLASPRPPRRRRDARARRGLVPPRARRRVLSDRAPPRGGGPRAAPGGAGLGVDRSNPGPGASPHRRPPLSVPLRSRRARRDRARGAERQRRSLASRSRRRRRHRRQVRDRLTPRRPDSGGAAIVLEFPP